MNSAGVEFIAENGGGAGVRLRKGAGRYYCSLKIVSSTFPFSPTMHTKV